MKSQHSDVPSTYRRLRLVAAHAYDGPLALHYFESIGTVRINNTLEGNLRKLPYKYFLVLTSITQ
jgi:hypothetical protein